MYGWRGRIGLIVPSSNTTNEPEFHAHLPEDVSLHTTRTLAETQDPEEEKHMADDIEEHAKLLATADVDVVAFGCTTGSLLRGLGYDEEIERRIRNAAGGVPAVTTSGSIIAAFEDLGLESLSIHTPYPDTLNEKLVEFVEGSGFQVDDVNGLPIEQNTEVGALRPETAYEEARNVIADASDGVFISCTNYRTFETISQLEADIDRPVVTSNQATLWNAVRQLEIDYENPELGTLFSV